MRYLCHCTHMLPHVPIHIYIYRHTYIYIHTWRDTAHSGERECTLYFSLALPHSLSLSCILQYILQRASPSVPYMLYLLTCVYAIWHMCICYTYLHVHCYQSHEARPPLPPTPSLSFVCVCMCVCVCVCVCVICMRACVRMRTCGSMR